MKVSRKFYYHELSWDFLDYLLYRPQLRGNSKKKAHRLVTRKGRHMMKRLTRQELLEYNIDTSAQQCENIEDIVRATDINETVELSDKELIR